MQWAQDQYGERTMQKRYALVGAVLTMTAIAAAQASAEVRDADYRGTLVCEKLPFARTRLREAIDVTIAHGNVSYTHVVRFLDSPQIGTEKGDGALNGQDLTLQGSWEGVGRRYQASYRGTFVRRSARLNGTQTWTVGDKTVRRSCSGAVKRPLRAFLPRKKKT
jgi:hypothetical protein